MTNSTASTGTFNLVTEPWIPVLRTNGQFHRVGIQTALTEAGHNRQIAASNPMDNVPQLQLPMNGHKAIPITVL